MNKSCRLFWRTPGIIILLGFFFFSYQKLTQYISYIFMQRLHFNLFNIKKLLRIDNSANQFKEFNDQDILRHDDDCLVLKNKHNKCLF